MPYTPELTKSAIFRAAVSEFAAYGFSGARVDRIAAGAGVDKTALYAYFGNKRELFAAVLERELGELSETLTLDNDDLPQSIGRLFDYQRAHPEHLRLLMWEALEFGEEQVPGEGQRVNDYRRRVSPIQGEQRAGRLNSSVNPAGLWLLLAGMVNWPLALPQIARMTIGEGPGTLDEQRQLLVESVRRMLADWR
jgi:AcrR family transcriptional regulator